MYEEVRDYAELLDEILVKIKNKNLPDNDQKKLLLSEFLGNICNGSTANLTARYIGLTLNSRNKKWRSNLSQIAEKLTDEESLARLKQNEVRSLEDLAKFLEGEQAEAAARIRGER
jgi:hypothetical protein